MTAFFGDSSHGNYHSLIKIRKLNIKALKKNFTESWYKIFLTKPSISWTPGILQSVSAIKHLVKVLTKCPISAKQLLTGFHSQKPLETRNAGRERTPGFLQNWGLGWPYEMRPSLSLTSFGFAARMLPRVSLIWTIPMQSSFPKADAAAAVRPTYPCMSLERQLCSLRNAAVQGMMWTKAFRTLPLTRFTEPTLCFAAWGNKGGRGRVRKILLCSINIKLEIYFAHFTLLKKH